MKNLIKLLLLTFLLTTNINSQNEDLSCVNGGGEHIWQGQIGGWLLPSEGTIKCLFIFAQFPDDNYQPQNSGWVKGQPISNLNSWVDNVWSSSPTTGSMTHYFNEMSFNKLKFVGQSVSVVTPHSREWYLNNHKVRKDIHTEILQQLDATMDFAQFDNWDYEGNYNHINQPDGVVDMIFIVWRNISNEFPKLPIDSVKLIQQNLDMGRYADLGFGPDIAVDNGQRVIKMGVWPNGNNPGGSGATLIDFFIENMFRFCIHEFGHYLQGDNSEHIGYGFWGLCSGWGIKSFVANAFERYRLGWINIAPTTIPNSPSQTYNSVTIPDFVTSGVAYRLVINASTNEYFFLENHQKNSYWENNQMYGTVENGIYVLRQNGPYGVNVQCIPADGRYNWTVNQLIPNPWGSGNLPVFKRLISDRNNGYHDLQFIPWTWNGVLKGPDPIHFTENKDGQPVQDVKYAGDGKDAFRLGYNEVFSPYSNPNSQNASKNSTPFGFKINSIVNGTFSTNIYVNTSTEAPPSKPTGLTVSAVNCFAQLNWEANPETDMRYLGKYKIFRASTYGTGEPTNWIYVTTINAYNGKVTVTTWTDYDVWVGGGSDRLYYRITAVDNSLQESLPSEYDWVAYDHSAQKPGHFKEATITEYKLNSNYPNPFNPSTLISYQLPSSCFVKLKVYDVIGTEVTQLVSEFKESGYYQINFNASHLSSGVYVYRLEAYNGERMIYNDSKQMLLIK